MVVSGMGTVMATALTEDIVLRSYSTVFRPVCSFLGVNGAGDVVPLDYKSGGNDDSYLVFHWHPYEDRTHRFPLISKAARGIMSHPLAYFTVAGNLDDN
jgi:hypothetical protein